MAERPTKTYRYARRNEWRKHCRESRKAKRPEPSWREFNQGFTNFLAARHNPKRAK